MKLVEDMEFLLRAFINICNMWFEGKFIIQSESKVFEMINPFNSLVVYDNGCQVRRLWLGVWMSSSLVSSTFSSRKLLEHHLLKYVLFHTICWSSKAPVLFC